MVSFVGVTVFLALDYGCWQCVGVLGVDLGDYAADTDVVLIYLHPADFHLPLVLILYTLNTGHTG